MHRAPVLRGHIFASDDGHLGGNVQAFQELVDLPALTAGGDGPARADFLEKLQQVFCATLHVELRNFLAESAGAIFFDGLDFRLAGFLAEPAQERGEGCAPGHYMFVGAINERAIEIEKQRWDRLRSGALGNHTDAAVALGASAERAVTTVLHSSAGELNCGRVSCVHVSC